MRARVGTLKFVLKSVIILCDIMICYKNCSDWPVFWANNNTDSLHLTACNFHHLTLGNFSAFLLCVIETLSNVIQLILNIRMNAMFAKSIGSIICKNNIMCSTIGHPYQIFLSNLFGKAELRFVCCVALSRCAIQVNFKTILLVCINKPTYVPKFATTTTLHTLNQALCACMCVVLCVVCAA